jgi:uncharacterized membrane protein (UPF0127 family)
MTPVGQLVNLTNGRTVVDRLSVADTFVSRLLGLQFRPPLPAGDGLLLCPCNSIHTCCMRFALDLVCLDKNGSVVEVRTSVRPWRILIPCRATVGILEVSAGSLHDVTVGDRLRFCPHVPGAAPPRRLQFLA